LAVVNAVNTTPVTWYVHVDHLNRPFKMTTSTKASVWDAVWQPWGNAHTITGTAVLDARFPGQWFQLETGLDYNWHRSYDPSIGRYTQPDPLGFVDGPSVFGYARGAPQIFVDPHGLSTTPYSLPFPDPDGQPTVPTPKTLCESRCVNSFVTQCMMSGGPGSPASKSGPIGVAVGLVLRTLSAQAIEKQCKEVAKPSCASECRRSAGGGQCPIPSR
jgi:RHS repeat-associated protein